MKDTDADDAIERTDIGVSGMSEATEKASSTMALWGVIFTALAGTDDFPERCVLLHTLT